MLNSFHLEPHLHSYLPPNNAAENRNCHVTQYEISKVCRFKSLCPGTQWSRSSSIAFVTRMVRVSLGPVPTRPTTCYSSQFTPAMYIFFNRLAPTVYEFHQQMALTHTSPTSKMFGILIRMFFAQVASSPASINSWGPRHFNEAQMIWLLQT